MIMANLNIMTLPSKQMLAISVHDQNTDAPYLKFELEDYYRDQNRKIHTERALDTFDILDLRANEAYVDDLGFVLILGLLIPGKLKDRYGNRWAQFVYPHFRGANAVLRIDEEPYTPKRNRKFCATLPLRTIDIDEAIDHPDLRRRIGMTVLDFLPIEERFCQNDKQQAAS